MRSPTAGRRSIESHIDEVLIRNAIADALGDYDHSLGALVDAVDETHGDLRGVEPGHPHRTEQDQRQHLDEGLRRGDPAWTTTSPAGRTTLTTIDAAGRPAEIAIPNVAPLTFTYDAHGRLSTTTQGSRTWTQTYDAQGYLASITDPLAHAISYTNDPVGRPTQTQLADGRLLGAAYDGNSNTTDVTLPRPESHAFAFTPVDLLASYTPPSVGTGPVATQYAYDVDRHLKTVTRPDGATINYGYDGAGRLQTTAYPQGTLTFGYDATTGQLTSKSAPSGETLRYAYDGFLKTGVTWGGPVAGSVSFGFDTNFRMTSQTVNGTALAFGYDLDGLLTGAGALTLTLDTQNGHLNGTTLGAMTDSYGYDTNGLFASYTAKFSGAALYAETVLRDAIGRITQKTETVQGTTHVWGYTFDATGRLTHPAPTRDLPRGRGLPDAYEIAT